MINLKSSGSGITVWSTSFSHPEQTSGTVSYTLTHNKGKIPMSARIYEEQDSTFYRSANFDYASVISYNINHTDGYNSVKLDIGRLGPGTKTVWVDLYFN